MNKILITGITGQDGIFLTEKILSSYPEAKFMALVGRIIIKVFMKKFNFLIKKLT